MIGSLFYRRSNSNSSLLLQKNTLYHKTREYWSKLLVINIIQVLLHISNIRTIAIAIALCYFLFPLKHNYKIPWKVRFAGGFTTNNTYVNITESRCIRPCCKLWFHPWYRMLKRSPGLNQLSWVFCSHILQGFHTSQLGDGGLAGFHQICIYLCAYKYIYIYNN